MVSSMQVKYDAITDRENGPLNDGDVGAKYGVRTII